MNIPAPSQVSPYAARMSRYFTEEAFIAASTDPESQMFVKAIKDRRAFEEHHRQITDDTYITRYRMAKS